MNAHASLKPLGMPKGMDPRAWRQSVQKRLNDHLDKAMSLITALDLMEADCDLEETADDEPSLGWTERGGQSYFTATAPKPCQGAIDDLEQDSCDNEEGGDAEPLLGWSETWGQGPVVGITCNVDACFDGDQ